MQSSPPHSDGKARAIRELSRSLSHSPRATPSLSPPPSDSNPTKNSGFGSDTSNWDNDVIMSTQHNFDEETNTLPQYPRIRSTAKKINSWSGLRSEPPNPDTSMVNKEFGDFDHSVSDEEDISLEQARGGNRSNRSTPAKLSSHGFNSLYDMTPPSKRKSFAAETGSLRRDAQIRRASRNDFENASPRPASTRNTLAGSANDRRRTSLAQLHAKVSEDESSFMDERPATVTLNSTKNTRWGNSRSRQASLQMDGLVDPPSRVNATPRSRPMTAQNATAQSFILPDLPNLTELVSGVFEDGTPVFSKNAPPRSRFGKANGAGGRQPSHHKIENLPIPDEEKAIFSALQLLQDKVAQLEQEHADAEKRIEEQDLELIELRATIQAQEKLRRSDSAHGSDGDAAKGSWKVEKTRLDAMIQTLRTKLDRADRKVAVLEIEKKRLNSERDNMAGQLGVGFQNFEDIKNEREALRIENDNLRQEIDSLRAENEELRYQLEQDQAHYEDQTTQLRRQLDQADNATQRENITLQADLARARAQNDDHTQQLARKDIELKKARQEQAEYARLKKDNDALQSKLASLKAKREEELHRWSNQEASLKAKVERRDETIRHFQDMTQEQTNEAVRLDNENLRQELEQLTVEHQDEIQRWSKKEADLKRKIHQRENAARQTMDMTREVLSIRQANGQYANIHASASADKENGYEASLQRKPSHRREDTRTRIKNRVQEEIRNSKTTGTSDQPSHIEDSWKSYAGISRSSRRASQAADANRSVSAPVPTGYHAQVESDVESTTDLSLAPRGTPYTTRNTGTFKSFVAPIQPPADLDLTELSFIDSNQIAQLRRTLEEERAAARRRSSPIPKEREARDDTIRSERQVREDTVRSVASAKSTRQLTLPRKSSLKDVTQRTNITQFEEDLTGGVSNLDGADADATQTKQSEIDASMLSNTGRRRRSAPTEMTSAFIVPDIKIDSRKQTTIKIDGLPKTTIKGHDNTNCTVCRREGIAGSSDNLKVPKLVPVSSRMPDDIDATLRPARSPKEALALVVKELQDERAHLHMELAIMRAMLESHDVSLGNRKRKEINECMQDLLRRIEIKDTQIYNLYDVLEGQHDHDITEQDVENLTQQVRAEDEKVEKKEKTKRVTIQSFVDEDEEPSAKLNIGFEDEDEALPWEGFEDTNQSMSLATMDGWRTGVY